MLTPANLKARKPRASALTYVMQLRKSKRQQGISVISGRFSTILVVTCDDALRAELSAALAGLGSSVVEADDAVGAEAVAAGRRDLALMLVDLDAPRLDGPTLAARVRALDGPVATVPILGVTERKVRSTDTAPGPKLDDVLRRPLGPEGSKMLTAWLPDGDDPAGARLAELFDGAEVARLVASLRNQLAAAVAELDALGTCAHAHRLAGLAGMLDLADVHRAWLALSKGDDSAAADARRVARIAVAQIDRERLFDVNHSTSV